MHHPDFRNLAWSLRAIRRQHEIISRAAETNQFPKRFRTSSSARSADRIQPEPRHDAADQLPITMLADQHMGFQPGKPQRHHELLGMPERQNHAFPLRKPLGKLLRSFYMPCHGPAQQPNDVITDRRDHRDFERVRRLLE